MRYAPARPSFDILPWLPMLIILLLGISMAVIAFASAGINVATYVPPPPPVPELPPLRPVTELKAEIAAVEKDIAAKQRELAELIARNDPICCVRRVDPDELRRLEEELRDRQIAVAKEREWIAVLEAELAGIGVVDITNLCPISGAKSSPQLVECVQDAVIVHPGGERIAQAQFDQALAGALKARKARHVVFVVRPSGFESFLKARTKLEQSKQFQLGWIPFAEQWQLASGKP